MTHPFRLILDSARPAAENMAIDEVLMESQSSPQSIPVLRIYSWKRPSISVGYFQNAARVAERFECARKKIPLVRRITGGGMVLHGKDLTFSLALKNPNPFFSGEVKNSYLKINEALRKGFSELYPKLDYADCKSVPSARGSGERICFEAPSCYDLLLDGRKVVGASQRRIDGTILHQATVFLENDRSVLTEKMLEGFQKEWAVNFEEKSLTVEELGRARKKEQGRYSSSEWGLEA